MEQNTPSHSKIEMCTYGDKIGPRQETEQENTKSCTFVLNTLESDSIGLGGPLPVTSHTSHSLFIPSPCMHLILADLSIPYVSQHFWSQMQHKHHTQNFNMMNTRTLALQPNPSDTQVATVIVCFYHDTSL